MKQFPSYRSVLVFAPIDEISRQEWDEHDVVGVMFFKI